ncbi:MAG: hypothetical protein K8T25_19350 [Planctomycetia bacterium]|nr:hypothetical protein [Planctomycetia bacterium]
MPPKFDGKIVAGDTPMHPLEKIQGLKPIRWDDLSGAAVVDAMNLLREIRRGGPIPSIVCPSLRYRALVNLMRLGLVDAQEDARRPGGIAITPRRGLATA